MLFSGGFPWGPKRASLGVLGPPRLLFGSPTPLMGGVHMAVLGAHGLLGGEAQQLRVEAFGLGSGFHAGFCMLLYSLR